MKPGPFTYHDPANLDDLVGLLGTLEDAKLLAGGQSLMPMLNMRFVIPDHVIDLNTVAGLDGIEDKGATVRIGAMTRQADLMAEKTIAARLPIMGRALDFVGHFQTRNRGTLGGSLSHLDPAAELPVCALLHDAELTVRGPDGERQVAMVDWPMAYMMPNLAPEEVLVHAEFTCWDKSHGASFQEFARRHGDFAIVAVGCLLELEDDKIKRAALAIGGARQTPYRLTAAEQALKGAPANEKSFTAAAELAAKEDAMSDAYVQAPYRQRLARVLTARALAEAAERAREA
jgi:carbon-monoxide dehydrogenase medium subunit